LLSAVVAHFGSAQAADNYIVDLMKGGVSNPWFELYAEFR